MHARRLTCYQREMLQVSEASRKNADYKMEIMSMNIVNYRDMFSELDHECVSAFRRKTLD
jgi:hypothetical protein